MPRLIRKPTPNALTAALALVLATGFARDLHAAGETNPPATFYPRIETIDPPENRFFTKVL